MCISLILYSESVKYIRPYLEEWIHSICTKRLLNQVNTSSVGLGGILSWKSLPPAILTASPCPRSFVHSLRLCPNASFLENTTVRRPWLSHSSWLVSPATLAFFYSTLYCHFVLICSPPGMSAPLQQGLSYSLFYHLCLEEYLIFRRHSTNICWMKQLSDMYGKKKTKITKQVDWQVRKN